MGSRVTGVMGFLPANFRLTTPFQSQLRVRYRIDKWQGRQTNAISALCPTLWEHRHNEKALRGDANIAHWQS